MGIGTSTPGSTLAVGGSAYVSGLISTLGISVKNTSGTLSFLPSTTALLVNADPAQVNRAARFTSSPYTIDIADVSSGFGLSSSDGTNIAFLSDTPTGAGINVTGGTYGVYAPSATNKNYFGGSVGIGTTTPGSLLSIQGVANFGTATSTFYSSGGLNLTGGGCYAINGTCIGGFTNTLANGGTATTTFYNGGVVFSDGTKLTQSSSLANFFWSESNARLGLGSSTPWAQLSVNPNGITGPAFAIGSSTATSFMVTNGGRVGIGTSSPYAVLSLTGPATADGQAATPFLGLFGSAGGITAGGNGGAGARGIIKAGEGGSTDTDFTDGGAGGLLTFSAGKGGYSGGFLGNGGTGGALNLFGGNGGDAVDGFSSYGGGGAVNITAGAAGTTGIVGGPGGNVVINGGDAPTNTLDGNVLLANLRGKVAVGSTSPYAKLSIHAADGATDGALFAIGSSTAAATTTLFTIGNTGILTSTASATSTFSSGLSVAALSITGSATSTAANGFNITGGCYAINGTCVGAGSFSNTLGAGGTGTTTFYNG
ncbi:MAG: hypothetical protein AB199_04245, partial [Parcubacteria bacterium C7867-004]